MSYAEAMESVPHIYLSVLSWLPEKAQLHSDISSLFKHLPVIEHKEEDWEGARWVNLERWHGGLQCGLFA